MWINYPVAWEPRCRTRNCWAEWNCFVWEWRRGCTGGGCTTHTGWTCSTHKKRKRLRSCLCKALQTRTSRGTPTDAHHRQGKIKKKSFTWQSQRARSWRLCRPAARTSRCQETGGSGRRRRPDWCHWVCDIGCWYPESWRVWRSLWLSLWHRWWSGEPRRGPPPGKQDHADRVATSGSGISNSRPAPEFVSRLCAKFCASCRKTIRKNSMKYRMQEICRLVVQVSNEN